MKSFELPAGTRLSLIKATPRKEHHGEELVQAISLRLRWETINDSLHKLDPGLKDMLFHRAAPEEAQQQIDGVPEIVPNLRCAAVAMPLKIAATFAGYTLTIEHGLDESSALELYGCNLDKFQVDGKEGGSVSIDWTLSSNKQITRELVGELCDLEGGELIAQLDAPKVQPDAIDASSSGDWATQGANDASGLPLFDDEEARADAATEAFLGVSGGDTYEVEDMDAEPALKDDEGDGDDAAAFEAGAAAAIADAGVSPARRGRARVRME